MSTRNYITVEPRTPWDQGWSLSLSLKLCIDTAQRIFFKYLYFNYPNRAVTTVISVGQPR